MTERSNEPPGYALSIGRLIHAPIAVVYDAWADATGTEAWLQGLPDATRGVPRLLDRPYRLNFSWSGAFAGPDTMIDISLVPGDGGRTLLLLTHARLASPQARDHYRAGWRRVLENLAVFLETAG